MAHAITAAIGRSDLIAKLAEAAGCPAPTTLPYGLAIAALHHEQIDRLAGDDGGPGRDGFVHLSEGLERRLAEFSRTGALAYVETNYFGGAGSQAAAAFLDGETIMSAAVPVSREPIGRDFPINAALRAIGVKAEAGKDEFDTLGLGRFRSLESLGYDYSDDD